MRFRNILLGIIILISAAAVLYISFDRIAIFVFEKKTDLKISYGSMRKNGIASFVFKDFRVINNRTGLGIESKNATIKPMMRGLDIQKTTIDFDFRDVRFVKQGSARESSSYDSLAGLVSAPFSENWTYRDISGQVAPHKNGIKINKLNAVSDEIKLSITGILYNDKSIDTDIKIYFAGGLIKKIPEDLSKIILTGEGSGWQSLSVHLSGNSSKPSIQVSSKLFRLNIRSSSDIMR